MKVGDYVRTLNGKIWIIKSQKAISGHKKDILMSSPNIIDLIEVGDYVNGHIVEDLDDLGYVSLDDDTIKYDDIKSIVTKEQFESMEYIIGE